MIKLTIIGDFYYRNAASVEDMQIAAVSGVMGDQKPIDMEEISQTIQLLSEETLTKIAKGPLVKFIRECNDIEYGSPIVIYE